RERTEPQIDEGHDDNADEEEDEQTDEAALNQNKDYRVNIITQSQVQENLSTQSQNVQDSNAQSQMEKDEAVPAPIGVQGKSKRGRTSKKAKAEGLSAPAIQNQGSNAQEQTPKTPKTKAAPKRGTLQPREISVEISSWNREDEIADEDNFQGDGERIEELIKQRDEQWSEGKDQKIYINMETDRQRRIHQYQIISEIQGLKQLIEIRREQNDNPIQRNIRREESLSENVERRIGRRNSNTYITRPNKMVQPYIPDKETDCNMEKDYECKQIEQRNREITLQMHGLEEVRYLANEMDYATSIYLKPAFYHIKVSLSSISYLTFNFNNNNYAQKAMPFGTKHSPIFFAETVESILRQIRIHSEIQILNNCDDILLIQQYKQLHETQTIEIMRTLEQFGWTISAEKCETEPKQIITFLGWIWNLKEMNIRMSEERKQKMIQALNDWCITIYKNRNVKIRQLAALIGRLNFL
ncbi:MAG: hypothetical protein EZS28_035891, partial [Streblomastix strix]